jgi:hypothetical protein
MDPYRKGPKRRRRRLQRPDWNDLWQRLRRVYQNAGEDRQVAVLDNYSKSKEIICRKFGVVSIQDVNRIYAKIKSTS